MRVSRVVGMALATLRITETVKEILPNIPPAPVKSAFTLGVGAGLSLLLGERDPRMVILEAGAVAGLASLLHDVQDSARRFTDNQIAGVITRTPRRAMPLGG